MKIKIIFSVIALLLITVPVNLEATQPEADQAARDLAYYLERNSSLTIRNNYFSGQLNEGRSTMYATTLYQGVTYYLIAGGCSSAEDVDIALVSASGYTLEEDESVDKVAYVSFKPSYTGKYYVNVKMYDTGNAAYAHYCSIIGYQ